MVMQRTITYKKLTLERLASVYLPPTGNYD